MEDFLTSVNDINVEILLNIVEDLDLINICETNKYAAEIYKNDNFWNQRIQRIYGFDFRNYRDSSLTYKQIYDKIRKHDGELLQVFINSANDKYLPLVKFIIENNVDVRRMIYDWSHLDALICSASGQGQIDILKYLLRNSKIIRHIEDEHIECHALISAARSGHIKIIKYLIEELGLLTTQYGDELCEAAKEDHLDVVKYLLENGVYSYTDKDDALMAAADGGNTEIVKYLIEEIGVDPHADNDNLIIVAIDGNIEGSTLSTVKYLIEVVGM